MELVGVVVVLAVLLTVAVPMYTRTIDRSYWRAARDVLQTIYAGERAYCFSRTSSGARQYAGPLTENSPSTDDGWGQIFMDNPNSPTVRVTFRIDPPGEVKPLCDTSTFTARAISQTNANHVMTINEKQQWCVGNTTNPNDSKACGSWSFPR